jgi:hypothetical protein
VITTIMFNFIAASLMTYLLVNVLIKPGQQSPESREFGANAFLPAAHELFAKIGITFSPSPWNLAFAIALLAAALLARPLSLLRALLVRLFLPRGSLPPEYLLFQALDSLQALCSYLRGVLTLHSTLTGAGIASAELSPGGPLGLLFDAGAPPPPLPTSSSSEGASGGSSPATPSSSTSSPSDSGPSPLSLVVFDPTASASGAAAATAGALRSLDAERKKKAAAVAAAAGFSLFGSGSGSKLAPRPPPNATAGPLSATLPLRALPPAWAPSRLRQSSRRADVSVQLASKGPLSAVVSRTGACVCVCERVCVCVRLCLSVCLSVCLPVCGSVCLSACLPVCVLTVAAWYFCALRRDNCQR